MLIMGTDFINTDASFDISMKRNGPSVFLRSWAENGVDENTPVMIQFGGSGYNATAIAASNICYIGVPEGTQSVGAGSWGWFQITGPVDDVQGAATSFTGSIGHAVHWAAGTGLGASGSAYVGASPSLGRIGTLREYTNESTTANIYLTGVWCTGI